MAIQKICDGAKCKRAYRPSEHAVGIITLSVYDSCHDSWPGSLKYDFCPSCTEKIEKILQEFMGEPK